MRVFIGSSGEQVRLVEWLTAFMRAQFGGRLEPVPWTVPWPGGRFTLENLQQFVEDTDASILFWTADDRTWYRDTVRNEPRDNLVFEAGLFIAAHGRQRTRLMIPTYAEGDPRGRVAVPSDVSGLTWIPYQWADGAPEATGLPRAARIACDELLAVGPRPRRPSRLQHLSLRDNVEDVRTFVGDWHTLHVDGIARLAAADDAQAIDLLSVYRVGEIRRVLDNFKRRRGAQLRACFANVWDDTLLSAYQRKYADRTVEQIRSALDESIRGLLGQVDIDVVDGVPALTNIQDPPIAEYAIRLTPQRITYSYYRIDNVAFIVPLDMKRAQNPAPLAWVLDRETAPRAFDHYLAEYGRLFEEASRVFPR